MLTKDDLLAIGNLIDEKLKPIDEKFKPINSKLDTLELNIETLRKESRTAHNEIMDKLAASNEIQSQEVAKLEKRVTALEKDFHKN